MYSNLLPSHLFHPVVIVTSGGPLGEKQHAYFAQKFGRHLQDRTNDPHAYHLTPASKTISRCTVWQCSYCPWIN